MSYGAGAAGISKLTREAPDAVTSPSGVLVVNCSSTGHPVDGDPRPAYALVETQGPTGPRGRIVRFDYPKELVAEEVRRGSLPKRLAKDFLEGNKKRETP